MTDYYKTDYWREYYKKYREANKEKLYESKQIYREQNKEHIKNMRHIYYLNNKDKYNVKFVKLKRMTIDFN